MAAWRNAIEAFADFRFAQIEKDGTGLALSALAVVSIVAFLPNDEMTDSRFLFLFLSSDCN